MNNLILLLILLITIITYLFDQCDASISSFHIARSILSIKGGKTTKSNKFNTNNRNRKEKEYKSYNNKSNKRKSNSKRKTKSRRMDLIPWGNNLIKSKGKGLNIKERLEEIAKKGQSAYKDIYRRAKVMKSSAFEGMLLKATWPGNEPVPNDILNEIIKHSIPAFKYSQSSMDDDPYHMTLHKIWTKMCEKDWRTVSKSFYLLHCIVRDSSVESCEEFTDAIKEMSRTRNPKKPDHKYFDIKLIKQLDSVGESYKDFVVAYAQYVLYRSKNFHSKFNQLDELTSKSPETEVVALLKKAQQSLNLGLKVSLTKKDQYNAITGQILKLLAVDLRDLYQQFTSTLLGIVDSSKGSYASPKANNEDVLDLLNFHKDYTVKIKEFLSRIHKNLQSQRIKIITDLTPSISSSLLDDKIKQLTGISGGAKPKVSKSEEEEEDEEEEDDGDDEEEAEEDDSNEDEETEEEESDETKDNSEDSKDDEEESEDNKEVNDEDDENVDKDESEDNEISEESDSNESTDDPDDSVDTDSVGNDESESEEVDDNNDSSEENTNDDNETDQVVEPNDEQDDENDESDENIDESEDTDDENENTGDFVEDSEEDSSNDNEIDSENVESEIEEEEGDSEGEEDSEEDEEIDDEDE